MKAFGPSDIGLLGTLQLCIIPGAFPIMTAIRLRTGGSEKAAEVEWKLRIAGR